MFERHNPADLRQVVSIAPESTADDVAAAVAAARQGLAQWRRATPTQRADVLGHAGRLLAERADAIAAEMVAEEGKPLADARNEATRRRRTSSSTPARPTASPAPRSRATTRRSCTRCSIPSASSP